MFAAPSMMTSWQQQRQHGDEVHPFPRLAGSPFPRLAGVLCAVTGVAAPLPATSGRRSQHV